jgi:hypothetical protein
MNTRAGEIKVVLGDEYDEALKSELISVVKKIGGKIVKTDGGVAGSQEFHEAIAEIGNHRVRIESETYVGLSIAGDQATVEKLCHLLGKPVKNI